MNNDISSQIKDAVSLALIQQKQEDHEKRIAGLEKWKWWLMSGLVYVCVMSSGTLLLMVLERIK